METQLNGRATEASKSLQDKAAKFMTETKDQVAAESKAAVARVDREAHKQPWTFIAAAALFAAMFGILLGRKSKA